MYGECALSLGMKVLLIMHEPFFKFAISVETVKTLIMLPIKLVKMIPF